MGHVVPCMLTLSPDIRVSVRLLLLPSSFLLLASSFFLLPSSGSIPSVDSSGLFRDLILVVNLLESLSILHVLCASSFNYRLFIFVPVENI